MVCCSLWDSLWRIKDIDASMLVTGHWSVDHETKINASEYHDIYVFKPRISEIGIASPSTSGNFSPPLRISSSRTSCALLATVRPLLVSGKLSSPNNLAILLSNAWYRGSNSSFPGFIPAFSRCVMINLSLTFCQCSIVSRTSGSFMSFPDMSGPRWSWMISFDLLSMWLRCVSLGFKLGLLEVASASLRCRFSAPLTSIGLPRKIIDSGWIVFCPTGKLGIWDRIEGDPKAAQLARTTTYTDRHRW